MKLLLLLLLLLTALALAQNHDDWEVVDAHLDSEDHLFDSDVVHVGMDDAMDVTEETSAYLDLFGYHNAHVVVGDLIAPALQKEIPGLPRKTIHKTLKYVRDARQTEYSHIPEEKLLCDFMSRIYPSRQFTETYFRNLLHKAKGSIEKKVGNKKLASSLYNYEDDSEMDAWIALLLSQDKHAGPTKSMFQEALREARQRMKESKRKVSSENLKNYYDDAHISFALDSLLKGTANLGTIPNLATIQEAVLQARWILSLRHAMDGKKLLLISKLLEMELIPDIYLKDAVRRFFLLKNLEMFRMLLRNYSLPAYFLELALFQAVTKKNTLDVVVLILKQDQVEESWVREAYSTAVESFGYEQPLLIQALAGWKKQEKL